MSEPAEALFYFAEQTSPGDEKINFDVQHGPGGDWWVEFDSCLHVFEFMNRNTRQYLGDNIMDALQLEKIQSQLAHDDWFGEMDHPYPSIDGQKLSEKRIRTIELTRRSHKIRNPRRQGNKLYGHIVSAGNDVGKGFANEIIRGMIPAFSCRCFGQMKIINGRPTIVVRLVVTYDWVLYAGFEDAKMIGGAKVKTGNLPITESAEGGELGSRDIAIPFSELALDISEKDGGVSAFLESMDMDASNILGLTDDYSKAIISPDKDHYIYAKMNPTTVNCVRDFYRSFGK
jgi:hypothetical protein